MFEPDAYAGVRNSERGNRFQLIVLTARQSRKPTPAARDPHSFETGQSYQCRVRDYYADKALSPSLAQTVANMRSARLDEGWLVIGLSGVRDDHMRLAPQPIWRDFLNLPPDLRIAEAVR